jgi:iron transport multicopper oxidase
LWHGLELKTSLLNIKHWHGIHQNHTNYQDGTEGVTQCPIIPNNTYNYNFQVLDQAGTFWYHSHVGTQYCDGLRGPLIIYDPQDPFKDLYDIDDGKCTFIASASSGIQLST